MWMSRRGGAGVEIFIPLDQMGHQMMNWYRGLVSEAWRDISRRERQLRQQQEHRQQQVLHFCYVFL